MNRRIRIKICGITRIEDAVRAAELGADALGLVFYAKSPRAVTVAQACAIAENLPPFITLVGLFVDAAPAEVETILTQVPLDLLQFHGNEPPEYCVGFARPYIKAVRMRPELDVSAVARVHANARGLLLDSYVKGVKGGTGTVFDWKRVPADTGKALIIAGGLDPKNAASAIRASRPYGVDVSGGVELAKGIKDAEKMAAFIQRCQTC
ncbi:MAG: phosphoribosylanthranilate isomerase [Gammaproteobacteria bacterium]|nr:phosphoribosylanthranilate isomerase [Gammaproteobacteria bacterium]